MPFQPEVGQELTIDDVTYRVAEHPAAPGMPYGQEGRQAIVYQLVAQGGAAQALKVFKPRYRLPALVGQADRIAPLATLPGLQVCQRTVLSARRHGDLLRQHPDLTYAVLMPWIEGPTWMEIMLGKRELQPEHSLALARSLAEILATMEEHGLAHCDLSGPNVILPALAQPAIHAPRSAIRHSPFAVELVDVEQLYGSDLKRPELLPGGSPGYAHKTAPDGLWGSTADRFAGAVILGEMLGWCDERVRGTTWGENYFDPQEMQQDSERFRTLVTVLQERWGADVAGLFERAWRSEVLTDCATFGEWLVMIPEQVPVAVLPRSLAEETREEMKIAPEASETAVRALMEVARRLEAFGNLGGALENYRQAQAMVAPGSGLADELRLIVQDLEAKPKAQAVSAPLPPEEDQRAVTIFPPVAAEQSTLDVLFDDGSMAYRRGEWAKANELLAEVVRQQPDYERDGQRAQGLLNEVERQLSSQQESKWTLGPWWALASALSYAIGLYAAVFVDDSADVVLGSAISLIVAIAVLGGVTGVTQWLVLRQRIRKAGWWILASVLGYGTGFWLGRVAADSAVPFFIGWGRIEWLAIAGAVWGTTAGVAQWLILRQRIQKAGWWVLASATGLTIGLPVLALKWWVGVWPVYWWGLGASVAHVRISWIVGWTMAGAIYGTITGLALAWLAGKPNDSAKSNLRPQPARRRQHEPGRQATG
jgi:hypothetical protein